MLSATEENPVVGHEKPDSQPGNAGGRTKNRRRGQRCGEAQCSHAAASTQAGMGQASVDTHGYAAHPGSLNSFPASGHCTGVIHDEHAAGRESIEIACLTIRSWFRQLMFCRSIRVGITGRVHARVRGLLGCRPTMPKAEQGKFSRPASKAISLINKGKPVQDEYRDRFTPFDIATIQVAHESAEPWLEKEDECEREMMALAKKLPAAKWVSTVKGFTVLGLASIVGRAGNLSDFPNPYKLRKFLGLAPNECYLIQTEKGPRYAVPRQVRATMWVFCHPLMLKGKGTHYYEIYAARKALEVQKEPTLSKMHAHNRAHRVMEQEFLDDLWKAWNGTMVAKTASGE